MNALLLCYQSYSGTTNAAHCMSYLCINCPGRHYLCSRLCYYGRLSLMNVARRLQISPSVVSKNIKRLLSLRSVKFWHSVLICANISCLSTVYLSHSIRKWYLSSIRFIRHVLHIVSGAYMGWWGRSGISAPLNCVVLERKPAVLLSAMHTGWLISEEKKQVTDPRGTSDRQECS